MPPNTRSKKRVAAPAPSQPGTKAQSKKSSTRQAPKTKPKKSNARQAPKEQTKKSIARQVQSIRDQSMILLRQSNAMLSISALPPETLSAIFIAAAAAEYEDKQTTRTRIYISCVSYHWRAVALSTPALWRRLVLRDYSDVPALRECMVRSKKLTLDLHLITRPWYEEDEGELDGEPHYWHEKDAKVLLNELPRSRSLHLNASPKTSRGLDWSKASKSLKHFILSDTDYIEAMPSSYHSNLDTRRYEPLALLRRLDTKFPNLQSLKLADHGVSLGDLIKLPTSLVDLRIKNTQPFRRNENTASILDVLRKLPALEQLSLTNATTKLDANALEHSKPVSLSRLKTFSYKGPLTTCLAFIKSLELPHSARRKIKVCHERGTDSDEALDRLGNELIVELAKWETRFSSAISYTGMASGLAWMAWKQPQSSEDLENVAQSHVSNGLAVDVHRAVSPPDLHIDFTGSSSTFRHELLFAHLKTWVLSVYSSHDVRSLFPHLGELEALSCIFQACKKEDRREDFFAHLCERNTPLPQLRVLRLRLFPFIKVNLDPVLALCQAHQKLDVHLMSCYEVSKAHLAMLRAVTNSVDWDGQKPQYRDWY